MSIATQLFKWYDIQDEEDFHIGTLSEAKAWLIDFWEWNNNDQFNEFELERFFLNIQKSPPHKLNDKMGGIDWALEEKE